MINMNDKQQETNIKMHIHTTNIPRLIEQKHTDGTYTAC